MQKLLRKNFKIKYQNKWLNITPQTNCVEYNIDYLYFLNPLKDNERKFHSFGQAISNAISQLKNFSKERVISICAVANDKIITEHKPLLYIIRTDDKIAIETANSTHIALIRDSGSRLTIKPKEISKCDVMTESNQKGIFNSLSSTLELRDIEKSLKLKYNLNAICFERNYTDFEKKAILKELEYVLINTSTYIRMDKISPIRILIEHDLGTHCGDYTPKKKEIRLRDTQINAFYHEYAHHIDYSVMKTIEDFIDEYFILLIDLEETKTISDFREKYKKEFVNFSNVKTPNMRQIEANKQNILSYNYYLEPREIFARFFSDWIQAKAYYKPELLITCFSVTEIEANLLTLINLLDKLNITKEHPAI